MVVAVESLCAWLRCLPVLLYRLCDDADQREHCSSRRGQRGRLVPRSAGEWEGAKRMLTGMAGRLWPAATSGGTGASGSRRRQR